MNGWDRFATGGDSTGRIRWGHNGSQTPDQAQARRRLGSAQRKRLRASAAANRHGCGGDGIWLPPTTNAARRSARSRGTTSCRRCERIGPCWGTAGPAAGRHHELRAGECRDASRHRRETSGCRAAAGVRPACRTARAHRAGCGYEGSCAICDRGPRDPRPCRKHRRAIGNGRGPASGRRPQTRPPPSRKGRRPPRGCMAFTSEAGWDGISRTRFIG